MQRAFFIFCLFASLSVRAPAQGQGVIFETTDMKAMQSRAQEQGKMLHIFWMGSWCPFSRLMEDSVFTQPQLGDYYNQNFINLKINLSDNWARPLASDAGITTLPQSTFHSPGGKLLYREKGYNNASRLLATGQALHSHQALKEKFETGLTENATSLFPGNDGRFTIGVRGKRLMYGYPYPYSTSHFVAAIDGKHAGNMRTSYGRGHYYYLHQEPNGILYRILKNMGLIKNPKETGFYRKPAPDQERVHYLSDTLRLQYKGRSLRAAIQYHFDSVDIIQKLVPVDNQLKPVPLDAYGQYYRIEYTFVNQSDTTKSVGLLNEYDTKIDDNDAARIEAFDKVGGRSYSRRKLNTERYYEGERVPGQLLVYRSHSAKTKELTGDFILRPEGFPPPDEVYIGSWPFLHKLSWKIFFPERVQAGEPYYDSAIITKWEARKLAPGDSLVFRMYYGLKNEGDLELVPANTPHTGQDETGKRIVMDNPRLRAYPQKIYKGDTSLLRWISRNPMDADMRLVPPNTQVPNSGSRKVSPERTTTYHLLFKEGPKILEQREATVYVKKRPAPTPPKERAYGQFALGLEKGQPITFGYPLAYSTSYFVLKTPNGQITNGRLPHQGITREKGFVEMEEAMGDARALKIRYWHDGLGLTQLLQPVRTDNNKPAMHGKSLQVAYQLHNDSHTYRQFTFYLTLDLAPYHNDEAVPLTGRSPMELGMHIPKDSLPATINLLNAATLYLQLDSTALPDNMAFKFWPHQHWQAQKEAADATGFEGDGALVFKWEGTLRKNQTAAFRFLVCSRDIAKSVRYTLNTVKKSAPLDTLFFAENKSQLTNAHRAALRKKEHYMQGKEILIKAFTDGQGSLAYNYALSKRRAEAARQALVGMGIPAEHIRTKCMSEYFSRHEDDADLRKVEIVLLLHAPK